MPCTTKALSNYYKSKGFAFGPHAIFLNWQFEGRLSRRCNLHRLFSTFPGGRRGAGLLILRSAIGVIAISDGLAAVSGSGEATVAVAAGVVAVLAGLSLLAGFLTPIASALVGLEAIALALSKLPLPGIDTQDKSLIVLLALVSVAVTLLGPGALSLDARLFGRREIIIPRVPRSPEA